jgi:hypothetical protein
MQFWFVHSSAHHVHGNSISVPAQNQFSQFSVSARNEGLMQFVGWYFVIKCDHKHGGITEK